MSAPGFTDDDIAPASKLAPEPDSHDDSLDFGSVEGLGDRIKAARLRCGLNQTDFAKALGVTQSAVSKWEICEYTPDLRTAVLMANLAGLDVAELAFGGGRRDVANGSKIADPSVLRDRLEALLEQLGKTMRGASLEAGLSGDALRNIARGKSRSPTYDTLARLAKTLAVCPDWFFASDSTAAEESVPSVSLEQRGIDVRRNDPHTITITQGNATIEVLDVFADDLAALIKRAQRCA